MTLYSCSTQKFSREIHLIRVILKKVLNSFTWDKVVGLKEPVSHTMHSKKKTTTLWGRRLHLKADGFWVEQLKRLDVVGNWRKEADGNKEAFDRSSMALLGLHKWVYKETSYAPRLTLIKRVPIRKVSRKIHALTRIFPTRKDPLTKKRMSTLHYYKNTKTFTNQGTHNLPQLCHSRVVKVL